MVEDIDARFMPGLNRELNARIVPPQMLPGIQGTIDLSRWLVPEEIIGQGVQFSLETVTGIAAFNIIRILSKPGKIIGIYNTNISVTTDSPTNARKFKIEAGTVKPADAGDLSATFVRLHGGGEVAIDAGPTDNPIREIVRSLGPYVVRGKMDYIVGLKANQVDDYIVNVAVMGYYFDEGMWPIGK